MPGVVFYEEFSLSRKKKEIKRDVHDLWDVCGNVGGIMQVF